MSKYHNMTKTDRILTDLRGGAVMTHYKALAYGTHRLAAIVFNLRKQGWNIQTRTAKAVDGTRYTEYFIPQQGGLSRFFA